MPTDQSAMPGEIPGTRRALIGRRWKAPARPPERPLERPLKGWGPLLGLLLATCSSLLGSTGTLAAERSPPDYAMRLNET